MRFSSPACLLANNDRRKLPRAHLVRTTLRFTHHAFVHGSPTVYDVFRYPT